MGGITDPPTTLHPSPLISISPFLTPFLVLIFLVAAMPRCVFYVIYKLIDSSSSSTLGFSTKGRLGGCR